MKSRRSWIGVAGEGVCSPPMSFLQASQRPSPTPTPTHRPGEKMCVCVCVNISSSEVFKNQPCFISEKKLNCSRNAFTDRLKTMHEYGRGRACELRRLVLPALAPAPGTKSLAPHVHRRPREPARWRALRSVNPLLPSKRDSS